MDITDKTGGAVEVQDIDSGSCFRMVENVYMRCSDAARAETLIRAVNLHTGALMCLAPGALVVPLQAKMQVS